MNRQRNLEEIRTPGKRYDIAIVGGGATGLGVAVDAASRGYSTVLVEAADFSKGTSSRSTKLVHGGVRYLQQGNIGLVLEALHERGLLYQNAPHLVHNMSFIIPSYKWWEGPFYGIGLKVYDRMAGRLGLKPSKVLSKNEVVKRIPTIEQAELSGGVIYYDGQFDDSRLAVHLAQTATTLGADLVNYVRCEGLQKEDGLVTGIRCRDEEDAEEFGITADCVINATGVFVDELRSEDDPGVKPIVTVSQGVHLVLPREFLPGDSAVLIPKTEDGRVLFAVPWHGCVVVGTTDTPLDEATLEPRALEEEKQFILEHAAQYLSKDPKPEDVLSIYAGLRPLVREGDGTDTAQISRDHTVLVSNSGLITVTGGKWTTYRKMGQDVVDQAALVAGLDSRACPTEKLQIHGWTREVIPEEHLRVYGSDARHIIELIHDNPDLACQIHPDLAMQAAEVIWHAREEMARTVEDVLARRTRSLLLNAQASIEAAPKVAELLAAELGEDTAWVAAQINAFEELAAGYVFSLSS